MVVRFQHPGGFEVVLELAAVEIEVSRDNPSLSPMDAIFCWCLQTESGITMPGTHCARIQRPAMALALLILNITIKLSRWDSATQPAGIVPPLSSSISDVTQHDTLLNLCVNVGVMGNMTAPKRLPSLRTTRSVATWLMLLLLCGDIHPNPGPPMNQSIYTCGFCDLQVSWSHRAVCCDECDIWYHKSCVSMLSREYEEIEDVSWNCIKCKSQNVASFTYHSYDVTTHNIFEPLASIPGDDSVFDSPASFHPRGHSSPVNTRQQPVMSSIASSRATAASTYSDRPLPLKKTNLRVAVVNCQGVRGKKADLENMCEYMDPDVLILTETKLDPSISPAEFLPAHYKGDIRKDVKSGTGGVMLGYRDDMIAVEAEVPSTDAQIVWGKFELQGGKSTLIGAYYRPPSDRAPDSVCQLGEQLESLDPDVPIILGGDFNAGDIDWENNTIAPGSDRKTLCETLIDVFEDHHLDQIQRECTRENAVLDLYVTNRPGLVKSCNTVPGIADHHIIVVDSMIKAQRLKKPKRPIKQWSKANWETIREETGKFRDDFLQDCEQRDVEENYKAFVDHIDDVISRHVPTKMSSSRRNVPWITPAIRRMTNKKQRLYNRAKRTHKEQHWAQYRAHKNNTTKALRKARWNYINSILQTSLDDGNSKPFWRYIFSQKNDQSGVAALKENGKLHSGGQKKAEILNRQFSSVFTADQPGEQTTLSGPAYPPLRQLVVNVKGIEKLLQEINPSKASGPDQVPCRILRELSVELAPVLTAIFTQSLETGMLPSAWRTAYVTPVFKKGSTCQPENYRPVSLTCVTCKVLEHIICSHIRAHLDKHGILSRLQHGFRASFSCETQLLTTVQDLLTIRDDGHQTDMVVLDFSKAFDKVPHGRLLSKLRLYGIQGPTLKWIEAFLGDRTQSVVVIPPRPASPPAYHKAPS